MTIYEFPLEPKVRFSADFWRLAWEAKFSERSMGIAQAACSPAKRSTQYRGLMRSASMRWPADWGRPMLSSPTSGGQACMIWVSPAPSRAGDVVRRTSCDRTHPMRSGHGCGAEFSAR